MAGGGGAARRAPSGAIRWHLMAKDESQSRILSLDALRGVAAVMVLLYHYTTRYDELYGHKGSLPFQLTWGYLGVPLFMIISGYVIFMSVDRSRSAMTFAVSRFGRLFPAFWASCAVTFGVVSVMGLAMREVPLRDALWNLTMIPVRLGVGRIDGVYWTLEVELTFYVVIFACVAMGLGRWSLAPIAAVVVYTLTGRDHLWGFETHWFALFLIGMTLYDMRRGDRWWHGVLLTLGLGCVAFRHLYREVTDAPHAGWPYLLAVGAFAAVIAFCSRVRIRPLELPPLIFLGTISYALYLVHQNIGYIVIREAEARGLSPLAAIGVAATVAIGIATIITFAIERPANRAVRGLLKRPSRKGSAATVRASESAPER